MSDTQVRVDGRQTFWRLCEHFDRDALLQGLRELGWERHCPRKRGNSSALKEALQELVRQWKLSDVLVRPLENVDEDGYAVVHEEPGRSQNDYDTLFTVRWVQPSENVEPYVVVDERSHRVDSDAVNQWFRYYRQRITARSVAKTLKVIITDRLCGTSLRPTGGFYWLPADSIEQYRQVIDVVYRAADRECKIYLPSFSLADPGAVEAVRDAIVDDIQYRRKQIEEQADDPDARKRALESRRKDAQALHVRVSVYEEYLGEALTELHRAADDCEKHVVDTALRSFPDFFGIQNQTDKPSEAVQPTVSAEAVSEDADAALTAATV